MKKRQQNHVAESRLTLPVVLAYATAVWLLGGLLQHQLWLQFTCFLVTTYLMVMLNNSSALIRVYSRTVSSSYAVMTCAAAFLFPSLPGAFVAMCLAGCLLMLFFTYQDKVSMDFTYYAFLCLGLASLAFVHALLLIPLFWLFMVFQLTSFSWRTLGASVLGVLTPYWLLLPVVIFRKQWYWPVSHFSALANIQPIGRVDLLSANQLLVWLFVTVLAVTGIVHYWRNSYADRIRIRQLYSIVIAMVAVTTTFMLLQPQHYDMLLRLLIISTSPLIAHFLTLTYTRFTNYAFYAICAVALLLTLLNLWMPSLPF